MKSVQQILALARPSLLSLKPYSSARDEFDQSSNSRDLIFLDANENPYPTPYNRYPDPHQRELKKKVASVKKVNEASIFLGNGSDEAIDLLIRAFCTSADNVVIPSPTYGMYAVSAAINEVAIKTVPLTSTFDVDVNTVMSTVDRQTKIIFICSPNNPTGNLLSRNAIENILEKFSGIVVVDEAYIDFTNSPSLSTLLERKVNLVILQTLSKAWGLAGLRLGMAFAHPDIIALLDRIKPPYNISSVGQDIAIKALQQPEIKEKHVAEILAERARLVSTLKSIPTVELVFPSDANFVLVRMRDARAAYAYLVRNGIVVRDRSRVAMCEGCLRISVGTPKENDRLLTALEAYE